MRMLSAAIIAIALFVVACGGDDDPTASQSPSVTATRTAIATGYPSSPTPTLATTQKPLPTLAPTSSTMRLIYTDAPFTYEGTMGPIWISDITGSQTLKLTPDGVSGVFAGMTGDPLHGTGSLYYVSGVQNTAMIYRITFPGGAPELVKEFTPWDSRFVTAALSPDERYVAYTDVIGLQLMDLQTNQVSMLAQGGDRAACNNLGSGGSIHDCDAFAYPDWSPSSSLLTVEERFYEGSQQVIIDPATPSAEPTVAGTWNGEWSPSGESICTAAEPEIDGPGMHIASAPDWTQQTYLDTLTPSNGANSFVASCSWFDSDTLAVSIHSGGNYPEPDFSYPALFKLSSGELTRLSENGGGEQCCGRQVFALPTENIALTQYLLATADQNVSIVSRPEAIEVATGNAYGLLQRGAWIVAVVTP